jgi:predicted ATPase
MELELKNIGMIKEANVKIDGLTVIARENDTGKSTVGKALFFIQEFQENLFTKTDYKKIISEQSQYEQKIEKLQEEFEKLNDRLDNLDEFEIDNLSDISSATTSMSSLTSRFSKLTKKIERYAKVLEIIEKIKDKSDSELEELSASVQLKNINTQFKDFFYFDLSDNIVFILEDENCKIGIQDENIFYDICNKTSKKTVTFIETPILANLYSFFSKLDTIQTDIEYKINDYPYTLRSLYKQLKLPLDSAIDEEIVNILKDISDIIDGEISIGSSGDLIFKRNGNEHHILSTATGIKTFGIFQMLIKNNYLTKGSILILDEPEVHLHPKWQLEMAKVIVELVKNGVKIVVNSHSPYMIEALEVYASKKRINSNFYLAEKKDNYSTIIDVTNNLEPIYSKLAKPIQTLEEESLENFKW